MSSRGLIDLRKRPPSGQQRLFAAAPRRSEPESPKRPMPLRARRRRVRAAFALAALIVIAALAYGVSYVSYLPRFSVTSITILGTKDVAEAPIRRFVETVLEDGSYHFISRRSVFTYPRQDIESAVKSFFPRLKSAQVSRASLLATAITVTVEERQPFALWCRADECYVMDEEGLLFAPKATSSIQTHYVFSGGLASGSTSSPQATPLGQSFVRARLPGLMSLLRLLGQVGFEALGASVEGAQDFSIPFRDGFKIKASFGQDGNTLVKNLELVLSSDALSGKKAQLEYVDLRFGNRVYYKLKGEDEKSN